MPRLIRFPINVNILLSQTNQPKLYLKALRWLLTSGKYIVVVVELLVIASFVYRFKLDADLQNLEDQINNQLPFIQSLKEDELLIRHTQLQLATIKQLKTNEPNLVMILRKLASQTPVTVKLLSIQLDRTQVAGKTVFRIIGTAPSNFEVSAMLRGLQKDPLFAEVSLGSVSLEKQLVNFAISGSLVISPQGVKAS